MATTLKIANVGDLPITVQLMQISPPDLSVAYQGIVGLAALNKGESVVWLSKLFPVEKFEGQKVNFSVTIKGIWVYAGKSSSYEISKSFIMEIQPDLTGSFSASFDIGSQSGQIPERITPIPPEIQRSFGLPFDPIIAGNLLTSDGITNSQILADSKFTIEKLNAISTSDSSGAYANQLTIYASNSDVKFAFIQGIGQQGITQILNSDGGIAPAVWKSQSNFKDSFGIFYFKQ